VAVMPDAAVVTEAASTILSCSCRTPEQRCLGTPRHHPRCPNGHTLGPGEFLVGHQAVYRGTAAGTPHGRAAHPIRHCAGRRSTRTAALSRGLRHCGSHPHGTRRRNGRARSHQAVSRSVRSGRCPSAGGVSV
jgi:hypothetical protein